MDDNLPNLPDLPLRLIEDGLIAKVFLPAIRLILHLRIRVFPENPRAWKGETKRGQAPRVGEAINRSLRGRLSLRHSSNFFSPLPRGCRHVLFRAQPPFLKRGRRSLKFFPCSRERYPHETCVDAFFKPPRLGEDRQWKKRAKGRRLRALPPPDRTTTREEVKKRRNEEEEKEFCTFGIRD